MVLIIYLQGYPHFSAILRYCLPQIIPLHITFVYQPIFLRVWSLNSAHFSTLKHIFKPFGLNHVIKPIVGSRLLLCYHVSTYQYVDKSAYVHLPGQDDLLRGNITLTILFAQLVSDSLGSAFSTGYRHDKGYSYNICKLISDNAGFTAIRKKIENMCEPYAPCPTLRSVKRS